MHKHILLTLLAIASVARVSQATLVTFSDAAAFFTQTGATSVGGFPTGTHVTDFKTGQASFERTGSSTFNFADWTTRFPGVEMAINGKEQFEVTFDNPIHSFGFDIVEVEKDPNLNGSFVDSTFILNFYKLGSLVGTHSFNPPNDTVSFVGVSLSTAFDQVELIESVGAEGNEFFGAFYSGKAAPAGVPDSGSSLAMLGSFCGILASARALRRTRNTD